MKYKINIMDGIINENNDIIQFFFIYPRFRILDGTSLSDSINKILNQRRIGDGLKKLKYKEERVSKYLNGLLYITIYEKGSDVNIKDNIEVIRIGCDIEESSGCYNCDFNEQNVCELYKGKIKYPKYRCDLWEERG